MSGSAATWRTISRVPESWTAPSRPAGLVPVADDVVTRVGVFEGKRETAIGRILEVYARKANSRGVFRWLAKISWMDGSQTQVRVERLIADGDGWMQITEGKKVWR